jgi:hypothetical protein
LRRRQANGRQAEAANRLTRVSSISKGTEMHSALLLLIGAAICLIAASLEAAIASPELRRDPGFGWPLF